MSHKTDTQLDILDGLRIFAMMLVLILHIAQRIELPDIVNELTISMGYAGVSIFFVLSGYLIPSSYERSGTKQFIL